MPIEGVAVITALIVEEVPFIAENEAISPEPVEPIPIVPSEFVQSTVVIPAGFVV